MRFATVILASVVCALPTFALATPGASITQSAAAQATPSASAAASDQNTLVKITTIEGKPANDEFTRNVQVLQNERQEIVKLNTSTNEAAAGSDARKALQTQLDAAVKRLDTDNQTMAKTYGYSILRNYVRIPEVSEVYVVLTEDEIAKQPASKDGTAPAKTLKVVTLNDAQSNQSFQTTVQNLQTMRQQAASMKATLDATTDPKDKAYQQGQFDLLLKQLNDANSLATKTYAFNLNRQYVMSIEKSTLYIAATPEEAAAAKKDEDKKAAEAPSTSAGKPSASR
jgi:hypothetical protein